MTNSKIILLSGTPMKDQEFEIANILNLILPEDQKLEVGNNFKKEYMTGYEYNPAFVKKFNELIKGRVSYLKEITSDVVSEYIINSHLPYEPYLPQVFKIYIDKMEEGGTQNKVYNEQIKKSMAKSLQSTEGDDERKNSLYKVPIQTASFVFPDESYGNRGYELYINENKGKGQIAKLRGGKQSSIITTYSLKKVILDKD